jgi:hypothetical protein
MLAVTLLLDRDLGLGHPVCLPGVDVWSQTVTVRQRRTARYPPFGAALPAVAEAVDVAPEWLFGAEAAVRVGQRAGAA